MSPLNPNNAMSPLNPNNARNRSETDSANAIQGPGWQRPVGEPHSFAENPLDPYDARNRSETDGANGIQDPSWSIQIGEPYSLVENPLDRMNLGDSFSYCYEPGPSEYFRTSLLSPKPSLSEDSVLSDRSQDFIHLANQPGTSLNGVHNYSFEMEDSSVSPSTVSQTENESNSENEACQLPRSRGVYSPEVISLEDSETEEESSDGVGSSGRKGSYYEEGSSSEGRSNTRESKKVRLPKERRKHTKCAFCKKGTYMLREMVKTFKKLLTLWIIKTRNHEKCGKRGSSRPSRHMFSDLSEACKKHNNKIHHKNQRSRRTRENTSGN